MLNGEFIECMAHDLEHIISMNSPSAETSETIKRDGLQTERKPTCFQTPACEAGFFFFFSIVYCFISVTLTPLSNALMCLRESRST